ncbi:hypothetical protein [Subtercola boreus]|nr:hypothetical protein [Subtercola boreus]
MGSEETRAGPGAPADSDVESRLLAAPDPWSVPVITLAAPLPED